ncbi:MAG: thiamin pyrophosphokinase [Clostridiaceae bacterium BRH_c20a]|nr:MAG: thiamin pyrophosphokinase [Clostridiaceae bacterium BRH_c20a]
MQIKGKVCVDTKTKNLTKRIEPGQIAVICHPDLDEIAAKALVGAKVKAVINAELSITGKYPNLGPQVLLKAGIPLFDDAGIEVMSLADGQMIIINEGKILYKNKIVGIGQEMTEERLKNLLDETQKNINQELSNFVNNTLNYAQKEKELILNEVAFPKIKTNFQGKHVVVVVRGQGYKEDLLAIKPYINEVKPIMVGVDGGADALLELGYKPHLIIGDMDSISDEALKCKAELLVHAYINGKAPGIERLNKLNLQYSLFPVPGTSEDAALLLVHAKKAELIVAVGTHSNMIDFLEKGRAGMASTVLVRIKVGAKFIDAKGVSKLYRPKVYFGHLAQVLAAGLIPIFIVTAISPILNQFWRIIILKLRLLIRV